MSMMFILFKPSIVSEVSELCLWLWPALILSHPAAGKHKIIALTNNYAKADATPDEAKFLGWEEGATPDTLRGLFDDFCDSSKFGMR